jgi:hypothetical protein
LRTLVGVPYSSTKFGAGNLQASHNDSSLFVRAPGYVAADNAVAPFDGRPFGFALRNGDHFLEHFNAKYNINHNLIFGFFHTKNNLKMELASFNCDSPTKLINVELGFRNIKP